MNTKNIILTIVLAAAALGALMIISRQYQTVQVAGQEGHHDIYYCPMHPHYTSDKPGVCPICQMKLVKKEGNPKAESKKEKKI